MKIVITGATGLVGSAIGQALAARGDTIVKISRSNNPGAVIADPTKPGDWLNQLDDCDAVIHLAGENLFGRRWNQEFKDRILKSRVESTRLIAERLAKHPLRPYGQPKIFISASAVGYYGSSPEMVFDESSPPGDDFMAKVCVAWEAATMPAKAAGVRVVHLRLGIVLDQKQGALPNLVRPFKFLAGGKLGSGQQWVSWIHLHDLVNALTLMIDDPSITGPVNCVSPNAVKNRELAKAIGKVLQRPSWLPAPAFAIRIALGEMAEAILNGQHVTPGVLTRSGFTFQFANIESALQDLIGKKS